MLICYHFLSMKCRLNVCGLAFYFIRIKPVCSTAQQQKNTSNLKNHAPKKEAV